jgi:hypothetical protein
MTELLEKIWIINQFNIVNDLQFVLKNLIHLLEFDENLLSKISNLLCKPLSIKNSINYYQLYHFKNEDINIHDCGHGHHCDKIEENFKKFGNIIVIKHPFMLQPNYKTIIKMTEQYQVIYKYILTYPHKIYIFGSKKSELQHLPTLPDVWYLDD